MKICNCAFLAFLPYILGHGRKWLEVYDVSITDVRTKQSVWADSTFLDFFSDKNVIFDCLSFCSDQSWICICYTYRRQWHLCHVIPLNKGESTGIVEANYSLPKVRSPGKKLRLDNLKLELVKNRHFATPNLIVACVSQEILHLAPSFFTGLRFHHRKAKKPRGRCPYYSNSCASRQLLLQGGDILVNPGPPVLKPSAPRYSSCEKPVAKNHKRCICSVCFDVTNAKC